MIIIAVIDIQCKHNCTKLEVQNKSSILTTVCITHVVPQDAIAKATIAYKENRCDKYQTADGTWLPL